MNPVDLKEVTQLLEEVRQGSLGAESIMVVVYKKGTLYFKEKGKLLARARLRQMLKKIL